MFVKRLCIRRLDIVLWIRRALTDSVVFMIHGVSTDTAEDATTIE